MKILVLGGGDSPEREISLISSAAVREALTDLGHEVGFFDPKDSMDALVKTAKDYELIFPILHGVGGEDGTVQKVLDESGVPYLGSEAKASELCFDKVRMLELLAENNISIPKGEVVTQSSMAGSSLTLEPFVLKPIADGSSVDMMFAHRIPYDTMAAEALFEKHPKMLLEKLITGVEITAPVLGGVALPVVEIVPPAGKDFDYVNKYNGATSEICPPKHLDEAKQKEVQALALKIHGLAGARHLSRTDMIVSDTGEMVVLEINTMPGMTTQSLLPKSAEVAGLPWHKLVAKFVELATSSN